jgi:hypothetical protein
VLARGPIGVLMLRRLGVADGGCRSLLLLRLRRLGARRLLAGHRVVAAIVDARLDGLVLERFPLLDASARGRSATGAGSACAGSPGARGTGSGCASAGSAVPGCGVAGAISAACVTRGVRPTCGGLPAWVLSLVTVRCAITASGLVHLSYLSVVRVELGCRIGFRSAVLGGAGRSGVGVHAVTDLVDQVHSRQQRCQFG